MGSARGLRALELTNLECTGARGVQGWSRGWMLVALVVGHRQEPAEGSVPAQRGSAPRLTSPDGCEAGMRERGQQPQRDEHVLAATVEQIHNGAR